MEPRRVMAKRGGGIRRILRECLERIPCLAASGAGFLLDASD